MLVVEPFAARKDPSISISSVGENHSLVFSSGADSVSLILTTEQVLQVSEVIEWYLFKRDDPAATLEEILEGLG